MRLQKHARRAACAAAAVVSFAGGSFIFAADVSSTWLGGTAGWNSAANWSNTPAVAEFPHNGNGGFTYDASVGAGTAFLQNFTDLEALNLSGGTIDLNGFNLTLNQPMNWTAGAIQGSGSVVANGGVNMSGSGTKQLIGVMNNAGSASWTDGGGVFGSGTFNNLAGASLSAEGTGAAFGIPLFNNSGTVFKMTPFSATNFGGAMTFNNTGTLNVALGTMNINGAVPQVSSGTLTGGTWFVSGTLNLNGIGGGGITTVGSGASVTLSGGGASFTKIDGITTNQGTFAIAGGQTFTTAGAFSNTGTLSVGDSSAVTITTSLAEQSGATLTGGTYFVGGTLTLPGAPITVNQGNFTLDGTGSICTNINSLIDNQGSFTISGGRTFTAAGAFNNTGSVHVGGSSSVLTLPSGGTHTGSFVVDAVGAISLIGGTHTFNTGSSFSGAGTLNINGSTVVTGNANLTVPASTNWNGGTIGGGGGSLDIPVGATFRTPGAASKTLSGIINNSGTTQWMGSSGVFGSGTFNNLSGATFQVISGSTNAFGVSQFKNAGTVSKTLPGTNNFGGAMTFNNTGTVNVTAGILNINGPLTQVTGNTLTAGSWKTSNAALVLSTAGNLTTIAGPASVSLSGPSSTLAAINTLANIQGAFSITNGRNFSTVGDLDNSGLLTVGAGCTLTVNGVFTNSGTVNGDVPGVPGTITASSYAMQSGSVSDILTGAAALTKTTSGTATLTGANTYTGGTTVAAGTLIVTRLHENNPVTISGGTLQVLDSAPTFPSHPAGDDALVSQPKELTISGAGQLDLGNNDMILAYGAGTPYAGVSPATAIEDLIASGFNGGDWLGAGITSSAAASDDAAGNFVLAVVDNATLPQPYGVSNGGDNFSGVDVPLDSVLVKFTHRVDLNLDGLVTDSDAILFSTNYEAGAEAQWQSGDLDFDGVFSDNDIIIFGTFYDTGLQHLPEPGLAALAGFLFIGGIVRRRRVS